MVVRQKWQLRVVLLWCIHMFTSRPVIRSLCQSSLMISTSAYLTDPASQRHQRSVRLSSCRADLNTPPLRPGLLAVVTVGLFRRVTPNALWAGSALTKVKTSSICLSISTSVTHTHQLYPKVRELMVFSARRERWFHSAFKRKAPACHAS